MKFVLLSSGEDGLCGDPGVPLDGSRTLLACDQDIGQGEGQFVEGCLITFRCDPGYRMIGESSSTCESNGSWSNDLPICERKCDRDSGGDSGFVKTRAQYVQQLSLCYIGFKTDKAGCAPPKSVLPKVEFLADWYKQECR